MNPTAKREKNRLMPYAERELKIDFEPTQMEEL